MQVFASKICRHYLIARIYIILPCSWSYGVLLWEMETGGVSSLLYVFSSIVCLPFHLYCFASVFVSSLVEFNLLAAVDQPPKVTMSFSSYAMLKFFFFLLFRFCFFFSYFYNQASNHILVWQPPNWWQSWRKATGWNSPTDVQMKCRISKQLFLHSFISVSYTHLTLPTNREV